MHIIANVAAALVMGQGAYAAFGFTSTSKGYKVDTDGGLTFEINKYCFTFVKSLGPS
jgi:rhamnogalacturonan endolyase